MRRKDMTGSVASIPKQRLENISYNNFSQVLQGSVPGVNITTNSGGAEQQNVSIMIRGRNSISANNSPLIVWDGIPYSGNMSDINPADIESMEILKDVSSIAIYGSRGSNGVILINSKDVAKDKKPVITYDGKYGIQKVITNSPTIMNGEEFYTYKMDRYPEAMTTSERELYESGN